LDDLTETLNGPKPPGISDADWTQLVASLRGQVDETRALVSSDTETAIQRYESLWARYVASVSEGLDPEIARLREEIMSSREITDEQRKNALDQLKQAEEANAAARQATTAGKGQEALAALSRALAAVAAARASSHLAVRGEAGAVAVGHRTVLGVQVP